MNTSRMRVAQKVLQWPLRIILVLAFTASPSIAYADAGTPLIWATLFHLLIGNAIIGIGEGLLIAHLFKARKKAIIWSMIAASQVPPAKPVA